MFGRRGAVEVLRSLIEFLLAFAVAALLMLFISTQKDTSPQQAMLVAEDFAQSVSALESAPGAGFITYQALSNIDLKQFAGAHFEQPFVVVKGKKAEMLLSSDTVVSGVLGAQGKWSVRKQGNIIEPADKIKSGFEYSCPFVPAYHWNTRGTATDKGLADDIRTTLKTTQAQGTGTLVVSATQDDNWPENTVLVYASDTPVMMGQACLLFNAVVAGKNMPDLGAGGVFPIPSSYFSEVSDDSTVFVKIINPTFLETLSTRSEFVRSIAKGLGGAQ